MKITNKEVLQSYILTTAKYDYSVYEKRILYRIIEILQFLIEGKKLNEKYSIQITTQNDYDFQIPLSSILVNEKDENYTRIKNAFKSLQKKIIEYEDNKTWLSLNLIERPEITKNGGNSYASFRVSPMIAECFMDFSKGFRKYELKVAMEFESEYSMRFYELLSNKKTPINYSIENLKEIFGLGNKYKLTANFINKVIVPAKKELDSRSPYTFHYETIKTGRKITSIHFVPIYQPQFEDENLKKQKLNKQMSNKWFIPKNIYDFLIHNFNFTDKELNNNLNLFENLYNNMSEEALLDFLVDIRFFASNADNPKGFIIGSLKKKAEQIFEQKYGLNNK